MALKESKAQITWDGGLQDGSGRLKVDSGAFPELTVTFAARTGDVEGTTNPEELIAGAHATCYAMALSNALGQQGNPPERLEISAVASLERTEAGLKISAMDLSVRGTVPGLSGDEFREIAEKAEKACPVSNALRGNVEIRLNAELA